MSETIVAYDADTLVIEVPVTFDAGGPVTSMAGASVAASAKALPAGDVVAAASAVIAGDTVTCSWPPEAMGVGRWRFQLRVTKNAQVQTVAEAEILVVASN